MLNILRQRAQSVVIQAVVLVIAVVFVFWGVGTNLGSKRNSMATVNDMEISVIDYQRAYETTLDNYRAQFGGSIPQGFLDALDLKKQVLNQLIQTAIVRQSGQKMGLNVSKVATQEEIKNMDVFQVDGQFDLNLYKQVLSQNNLNPSSFEASLRNDLLTGKVRDAVQGFAMVPDYEVEARYDLNNEEIKLAYYTVTNTPFLDKVDTGDKKLTEWYAKNKNNYLTDPQIRLKYLFFSFDDDLNQVEVPEEKLRQTYEANKDDYVVPEQRRARHILFEVKETDSAETRAEKLEKAKEILELARQGKDFAELAKEYSEGPSGPNGGDLGFFGRGAMVPAFDEAVFSLQPGEISDVVETRFGFHIIKLEEVHESKSRTFEEVRDEIARSIKQKEVKGYTFKKASKAYEDIILSGSLTKYSEEHEGNVQQTDYFSRKNPPGPPLSDPKLIQAAFSLKKGELSSLVESGDGYAILFADDVKEPEVPELETIKDRVVNDYKKAMSIELARKDAEEILKQAKEMNSLAEAVPAGETVQETDFIQRSSVGTEQEIPAQIAQNAFQLSTREPFPAEPFRKGDTFFVYKLAERKKGDKELDEQQRQQLKEQMLSSSKNELLLAWLESMRQKADIWVNEPLLQ